MRHVPRPCASRATGEDIGGAEAREPEAAGDVPALADPIADLAAAMRRPEQVDQTTPASARDAVRELERRLLGADRTMKRREVAAAAGVSLLSARKIWRALGFPNLGDEEVFFTEVDEGALELMLGMVRKGMLTEETAISLTRSIGQMTDRMVVWQVEALVEDMVQNQKMSDPEARRNLVNLLPDLIDPIETDAGVFLAPAAQRRRAPPGACAPKPGWPPPRRAATGPRTTSRCRWPAPWASRTWSPTPRCPAA